MVNTTLNAVLPDAATWGERPFRSSFERFAARVVPHREVMCVKSSDDNGDTPLIASALSSIAVMTSPPLPVISVISNEHVSQISIEKGRPPSPCVATENSLMLREVSPIFRVPFASNSSGARLEFYKVILADVMSMIIYEYHECEHE